MKQDNITSEIRELGIYNDKIIKGIIATKEGQVILRGFFRVVLKVRIPQKMRCIDKEIPVKTADAKPMRLDMLLDSDDMRIDVEYNNNFYGYIWFRNNVYFFSAVSSDQEEGKNYKVGKKYLLLNLSRKMKKSDPLIERQRIVDPDNPILRDNNFFIYNLNLDKARWLWDNGDRRKEIMYMAAFTMTNKELEMVKEADWLIKALKRRLDKMSKNDFWFTPEADAKMLNNSAEYEIAKSYAAGLTRGRKEAKQNYELGNRDGIKIGEEKGIKIGEKNTIINLVKKMLHMGKNYDEIMAITDVDKKTIDMLAKQL